MGAVVARLAVLPALRVEAALWGCRLVRQRSQSERARLTHSSWHVRMSSRAFFIRRTVPRGGEVVVSFAWREHETV